MVSWKELKDLVIICRNNTRVIYNTATVHIIKLPLKGHGTFLVDPRDIDLRTGFVNNLQYDLDSDKLIKMPNLKLMLGGHHEIQ